jgi:hypothetical protein
MKRHLLFSILALLATSVFLNAQNNTDVSLFMRSDSVPTNEIAEPSGDLYKTIGHHGPAIENEWMALRIYFNYKTALDVYSKSQPGLELSTTQWYPTVKQQKEGWGADYYKAGETVGLGGIKLWDEGEIINLNPVSNRTARVVKEGNISYMEMLSEDVPYKGKKVDILIRVTVYSGYRNATVDAFALTDEPVQFVTGINYHKDHDLRKEEGLIATWGIHPEDVAVKLANLGGAIIYNPEAISQTVDDGTQVLLISHPTKQLRTTISSASALESELNTMDKFMSFLKK